MRKASVLSILFVVVLLAVAVIAEGQQAKKIPTIGFLAAGSLSSMAPFREAFQQGIVDLGYVVGKSIQIGSRNAEGAFHAFQNLR